MTLAADGRRYTAVIPVHLRQPAVTVLIALPLLARLSFFSQKA
jgi:hypothetical protein